MFQKVRPPEKLNDFVWRFTEWNENGPYVDAYLVVGREKAVLIDALESDTGLLEAVRAITPLPLALVLTHGHPDHAGAGAAELLAAKIPVYLSVRDDDILRSCVSWNPKRAQMQDIPAGMRFPLGGLCLEAVAVPGHTPGSIALWEEKQRWLFSGDCIGSGGFWMQVPGCEPLSVFQKSLRALGQRLGTQACTIFPGHSVQCGGTMGLSYLRDLAELTDSILSGQTAGEPAQMTLGGQLISYRWAARGAVYMFCYLPQRL